MLMDLWRVDSVGTCEIWRVNLFFEKNPIAHLMIENISWKLRKEFMYKILSICI